MNMSELTEIKKGLKKDTENATELLVLEMKQRYIFKTTRDDDRAEVWVYVNGVYIPEGKTYIREYMRSILEKDYKDLYAKLVTEKIMADTYVNIDDFFNNNYIELVPVENGLLNVKEKKLYSFTYEKTFFHKINAFYDPTQKCPGIKCFLENTLDKNDVKKIIQFMGYCLYKDYPINKAFMFTGDGSNGKSRVLELIRHFLGQKNCTNLTLEQMERENQNFEIINLHGKLVNISGDISSNSLKKTGQFKRLLGNDLITAQRKHKNSIEFINTSKMVFCANELPYVYDHTLGFFRRWELIEFPYTFYPKKEYDLFQTSNKYHKLADPDIIKNILNKNELSGLLNWCLKELFTLLKNKEFDSSGLSTDIKNKWIRKSNSFLAFFQDFLEVDYNGVVRKSTLRREYSKYCRKHRIRVMDDKKIYSTLSEFGVSASKKKSSDSFRESVWEGIVFKCDNAFTDESEFSEIKDEKNFRKELKDQILSYIIKNQPTISSILAKFNEKYHKEIENKIIKTLTTNGKIYSHKPGCYRGIE